MSHRLTFGLLALMTFALNAPAAVLVPLGSTWKYLDDGSDQGTAWKEPGFLDGSWASGPAELGYGDTDEATVVNQGNPPNRYITTYFRHSFAVADKSLYTGLLIELLRDDGAVVYLNGTEVFRSNMPDGPIDYLTPASSAVGGGEEVAYFNMNASPALLIDGNNLLAVEIHQNSGSSSDISFNLRLTGEEGGNLPPTVALTNPPDNTTVAEPANLTLQATADDSDGSVTLVEFFANGIKIGEDGSAPYTFDWSGVIAGSYTLTAVATDNGGLSTTSAPIHVTVTGTAPVTFVTVGSVWSYLDDGSDQGTAWQALGFDDASWASGPAQLGYGDGDEATVVSFGPDPNNKYTTTYFRRKFTVNDPSIFTFLTLNVLRDDGAVVYLNGTEVFRDNMPTGPIDYLTQALNAIGGAQESTEFLTATVSAANLVAGDNILAVEIHQAQPNSSDISFDLELIGNTGSVANNPPSVAITSPANNAALSAPADILIMAAASDSDGSVAKVEFFQGGNKLGEDTSSPYEFPWNGVGIGSYQLTAVVTDNLGATAVSSPVNITVYVSSAPTLQSVSPPAGAVNSLSQITVTFSEPVQGVDASDLLINGVPADTLTGADAVYTFGFKQPREGVIRVAWKGGHGIRDFETPNQPFDNYAAGATWQYTLVDSVAPVVSELDPPGGATVRKLSKIKVNFSEPVNGVNASDLLVNSLPAVGVTGSGDGPYEFDLPALNNGVINVNWTGAHGITDQSVAANAFAGGSWSYNLNTNAVFEGQIVINEIMYHPSTERTDQEWVELFNAGATAVNLTGWKLNRGVEFVFPNVTIQAGGYMVVAADVAAFTALHPSVGNVVGGWTGRLSNAYDDVELEDADGDRVDLVSYADGGDFAVRTDVGIGWDWISQADGLGRSLELRNPLLPNNQGQNWLASTVNNGTPGQANSVASADIPPMILDAAHFPAVPRSSAPVTITARIVDELTTGLTVRLWYRNASSTTLPSFTSANMADNGLSNDGVAGDGVFGAVLPAMANGTIIEYYVEASDNTGHTRTWPAPADQGGSLVQEANALFQFDDEVYTGTHPIYRLIMRAGDRNGLINSQDGVQRNATFITVEGDDIQLRYSCVVRRRGASSFGANPPTMKLEIPADRLWKNKSSMNLNSVYTWAQVVGSAISSQSGLSTVYARGVQLRFNGENRSQSGSLQFGLYAEVEVANGEFARDHFPDDGSGNVYSKRRPECGLRYQGTNPQSYINCAYDKESNASENDWTDLMSLLYALDPATTPDSTYLQAVRENLNVEHWLRYFAVMFLMNYNETAMCTGADDDYDLYRGIVDPRFIVLPHDFDSIFGSAGTTANNLFLGANIAVVSRFLHHPSIEPLYYEEYRRQLAGLFTTNNLFPIFDQFLSGWVPGDTIQSMKNVARDRINYVASQLPAQTVVTATISGEPPQVTYVNSASLTVGGTGVTHYRYRVNNGALSAETPVATPISLAGLADGTYTVFVIGRNAAGLWQTEANATVSQTWTVLSSLKGIVFNEILARNVSAYDHEGTFPDVIELYNAGSTSVNLEGMRLTDDNDNPGKFTFPAGPPLAAGGYLRLYANNPDGTTGIHLGFSLNQDGEKLYLFDKVSNGGRLLDKIEFGLQLPDLSVGRFSNGQWGLTTPTLGAVNLSQPVGNPATLKINEWLANGSSPFTDDFIELYNPDALPVALGGLFLTDNPNGDPMKHRITALSFMPGLSFQVFLADDNEGAGADHLNFNLSAKTGEIGLINRDGSVIDRVAYGTQQPGISEGRSPNGSTAFAFFTQPTPGAGNPYVAPPPAPETVTIFPMDQTWKYDESGDDLGTSWRDPGYNDSAWPSGQALLAYETGNLPDTIRTPLTQPSSGGPITTYFRTHFNMSYAVNDVTLTSQAIIDDGMIVYINGQEAARFNMPGGAVDFLTTTIPHEADVIETVPLDKSSLVLGDNLIAVEVHQQSQNSSDVVFGLSLQVIILTNTPASAGVVINEVLADNRTLDEADGSNPDWVEIYNPSEQTVDLAGMSLTDDLADVRRWVFPAGSLVSGKGYLRIFFDSDLPASANNTGFGLSAGGDAVYLFDTPGNGGSLLDSVTFGVQAADWPIGRLPDGTTTWTLVQPTPGSLNLAVTLGDPFQLKVNEWMADPNSGDDWFEIFNPTAQPIALGGLHLTDDLNNRLKSPIPPLSFIGVGLLGFQEFKADDNVAAGANHVNFKLSAGGESLGIADVIGTLINGVTFGAQTTGVSEGRLPDGASTVVAFPETSSPGNSNYLPIESVVINEVLTHTDPPFEDAIELHNTTGSPVDVSGWFMSDARNTPKKFQIPNGTTIPANGYKVFYEAQFNPNPGGPLSFSLSSAKGDEVYLSAADSGGVLTGYREVVDFGPSENGVSFGRYETSVGVDFTAMSLRTFGQDDPSTVEVFRTGTGLPNSLPKVGPIVINEIMYHPPDDGTNDNVLDEYLELHNITAFNAPLYDPNFRTNTWRLRDAVKFNFPTNVSLAPGAFLVVVSFDPVADPTALSAFRTTYGISSSVVVLGPYEGKLDNSSDSVELYKPDPPQMAPSPDEGLVPYVLVDKVKYHDLPPWPIEPDGIGQSLQRVTPALYGNDPVNWAAAGPTPGAANFGASGNTPPVLAAIGPKAVLELNTLTFKAMASDTDDPAQTLSFSLDAGAPTGASINPTSGDFSWTPTEAQGPGNYNITVRVTDNGTPNLSDAETIQVTVNEVNQAPVLGSIGGKSVAEGSTLTFTATAMDADLPAQSFVYSLEGTIPTGASINPSTGVFTWTPTEAQGPGNYSITVKVTDTAASPLSDSETITVSVAEVNVPPVLAAIGNRTISVGGTLTFMASATDADVPMQMLTYSLDAGAPSGASINPTTGVFTWTPTAGQSPSSNPVTIRVTDNGAPSMTDFETITLTVTSESQTVELIALDGVWKYNDSGSDLGTAWRVTGYNDASWSDGPALLYNEADPIPGPKNTQISLTGTGGGRVVTYYFRTHFTLPAAAQGVTLTSSNLVDDGAIYYLNGVEVARFNMPGGNVTAATFSSAPHEANVFEVFPLDASPLVSGDNVLAVEVHQQSLSSSDVVFGLSLLADIPPQTGGPTVISVGLENGNIVVVWQAPVGQTFQLQYAENLTTSPWTNQGAPILSTTGFISLNEPLDPAGLRFFRLVPVN